MSSLSCVEQKGVVESIVQGVATVNISAYSACASCHTKEACQFIETSQKTVSVPISNEGIKKGDLVCVEMKQTLGLKAILLAYVLPFVLILITLTILTSTGVSEIIAGSISLLVLVPYFLIIYFSRNQMQRTFTFLMRKAN